MASTRRQLTRRATPTRRLSIERLEDRQLLSNIFTVTNTLDDGSTGSLRWAITQVDGDTSDSAASPDRIQFNIPQSDPGYAGGVWTIAPTSALPAVTKPAVIDGYTQVGATPNSNGPELADNAVLTVVLSGIRAPAGTNGLELSAAGITVRGLVVNGFAYGGTLGMGNGIAIDTGGGDIVAGNFLGTNNRGDAAVSNGGAGVFITDAGNNTIGGVTPDARNLVSGNEYGVFVRGANAAGNVISGNLIGTDATGMNALPDEEGVWLEAGETTIGGTSPGARNVISGNRDSGVAIFDNEPAGNVVEGNTIGLAADSESLLNSGGLSGQKFGIAIDDFAGGNVIGGTTAGAGNIISGNVAGVQIEGTNTSNDLIAGNLIGTDASGLRALGNTIGIELGSASPVTIGGTAAGARNVISDNSAEGILVQEQAAQAVIAGNIIGLDRTGANALGVQQFGIQVSAAHDITIGGFTAGAGNVIAGNTGVGVEIEPDPAYRVAANAIVIEGNLIGTDASGMQSVPNGITGIRLFQPIPMLPNTPPMVYGTTIGGTVAAARNVIADGVQLIGPGVSGNVIEGNSIGTVANDTLASAGAGGLYIQAGTDNTIGGTATGAGNVIASRGVPQGYTLFLHPERFPALMLALNASNNLIEGNSIGTDSTGTLALGNPGPGIVAFDGSSNNTIGGATPGARNLIAQNGDAGIIIFDTSTGDAIEGNSIFANHGLGIDLASGSNGDPNDLQTSPQLISTTVRAGQTIITGTLASTPNTTFTIELFANPQADPSSFGQGQTFLGRLTGITTDAAGNASFTFTDSANLTGRILAATATDSSGDTSAFSHDLLVPTALPVADLSVRAVSAPPWVASGPNHAHWTYEVTNNGPNTAQNVRVVDNNASVYTTTTTLGEVLQGEINVGSLPSGQSFQVTFSGLPTELGVFTDHFQVLTDSPDPTPADNSASVSIPILYPTYIGLESLPPSYAGFVTLTARMSVGPGEPAATGTVDFFDTTTNTELGTATAVAGSATLPAPALTAGWHDIKVTYSGDGTHLAGAIYVIAVDVLPDTTTTELTATSTGAVFGHPVTFSATVERQPSNGSGNTANTPSAGDGPASPPPFRGTITFLDGTTALATVPVDPSGRATLTISDLRIGVHSITASYSGDPNYRASISSAVEHTTLADGPAVLSVRPYGPTVPSAVTITFSSSLDPNRVRNRTNYRVVVAGRRRISVDAVSYAPGSDEVTLFLNRNLRPHHRYRITVVGTGPNGITDDYGNLLDGTNTGHPGSNYVTTFLSHPPAQPHRERR